MGCRLVVSRFGRRCRSGKVAWCHGPLVPSDSCTRRGMGGPVLSRGVVRVVPMFPLAEVPAERGWLVEGSACMSAGAVDVPALCAEAMWVG